MQIVKYKSEIICQFRALNSERIISSLIQKETVPSNLPYQSDWAKYD